MKDLYELATSGGVLPFTLLLIPIFIYWGFCLLGLLDLDFLDFNPDLDSELDSISAEGSAHQEGFFLGTFHGVMRFVNASDVPVMVILSFIVVLLWVLMMVGNIALQAMNLPLFDGWFPLVALVGSVLGTKVLTAPLKPLFRSLKDDEKKDPIIGKMATVRTGHMNDQPGKGGQVKLEHRGGTTYLNARLVEGELERGQQVVIFRYDESTGEYLVQKI